tara:strand:+ start:332 stop:1015 length:684 start_codon:yes stop_codon:yes gene_type:complete
MHNTVAILPFKRNSERVKGKNFKLFAGKELYKWTLDTLLDIKVINKIIINTDATDLIDNKYKTNSRVIIRERSADLRGDFTSMNLIIGDDIEAVKSNTYIMTHTTNPLITTESVIKALSIYNNKLGKIDSLFSVNKFQTRFYRINGEPVNHNPAQLIRTQDLEVWYEENSNLYIFSKESFIKNQSRIGDKPYLYETPVIESTDIDTSENWVQAEIYALHKMLCKVNK